MGNLVFAAKPYWVEEPQDIETSIGATAYFRCVANGEPAPVYKWFINGVKLEGETVKELWNVTEIILLMKTLVTCSMIKALIYL